MLLKYFTINILQQIFLKKIYYNNFIKIIIELIRRILKSMINNFFISIIFYLYYILSLLYLPLRMQNFL